MSILFSPLSRADVPLLTVWLQAPHVRAFWDDGERDEAAVEAHYFAPERDAPGFLFGVEGTAVGFLQIYPVGPEAEFAAFAAATGETWGVDLLIGDVACTGQGLGPAAIRAFLMRWQAERQGTLRRLLIDPEVRNVRAVRAYEKVGFRPLARRGNLLIMALDLSAESGE